MLSLKLRNTPTCTALTSTSAPVVGIKEIVGVSLRTMGFGKLTSAGTGTADATPDVFAAGDGFEMVRVNATPYAAEMIEFQSFRNRPDGNFIGKTMGVDVSVEAAVSARLDISLPEPTGICLFDSRPETFFGCYGVPSVKLGKHLNLHSGVVRTAALTARPLHFMAGVAS